MSLWQWVGVALVVIGLVELVLFRRLAPSRENIRDRMPLLMGNSAFNVVVGLGLVVLA